LVWLNFVNKPTFKLRTVFGSLYFKTTNENFFLFGLGVEILPQNTPIRIESWANLNPIVKGTFKKAKARN
jgi:hypothetical protein